MVTVTEVRRRSRAAKAGIHAGDVLVSVNGRAVNDVLDYRFYLAEERIELALLRDGKPLRKRIKKKEYDDIGLEFETPLMDKKHSCENKCVFCFIDQLPKGMRSTLYFKDDDSRLSFLHGNYITLTNLSDADIGRIIDMHISPVNVSIHTTNPELRVKMMKNKRAGDVLSYLDRLAEGGISLCGQIVLCKGLNDGEELARTMSDLKALHPALQSVSVVPAGLTRFRDGLYPLSPFRADECAAVIAQVEAFGEQCLADCGTRLFYPADEWYLQAGLPLPENDFYEEYSQIENGVGMLTDMQTAFACELSQLCTAPPSARTVSIATGYAAYAHIQSLCDSLCAAVQGLTVHVYAIRNDFFGEQITVAGLLTYTDLVAQLQGKPLGEMLFFPAAALRAEGDVFLDDRSPTELAEALGVPCQPLGNDPAEWLQAVAGITPNA